MVKSDKTKDVNNFNQFIPSPRMMIATATMQALIERIPNQSPKHIAMRAVAYADALIEELSKDKDNE